jgi:gluconate 2-dehydrogenase gamma chain
MSHSNEKPTARRGFLKHVAGAGSALPLGAGSAAIVALTPAFPQTAGPVGSPVLGYVCFSPDEAAFVEALVNIMCPADELTPNGVDCGLATFIDRQLAGDFGRGAKRYMRGPWQQGKPQLGYQLPLTPEQYFKVGVEAANSECRKRHGKTFDRLGAAEADAFLSELASGKVIDPRMPMGAWFNELVYPLFSQACFADPIYGGNRDKVFWKMIGYPGLPATNMVNMLQYRGKPFPGARDPKSISDFS